VREIKVDELASRGNDGIFALVSLAGFALSVPQTPFISRRRES